MNVLFRLILSSAFIALSAVSATAQQAETVCRVELSATSTDVVDHSGVPGNYEVFVNFPYGFWFEDFHKPFSQKLWKRWRWRGVTFYDSPEFKNKVRSRDLKRAYPELKYFLKRRYKKRQELPQTEEELPLYYFELQFLEDWTFGPDGALKDRKLIAGIVAFKDAYAPESAQTLRRLYFKPDETRVPFELLHIQRDYDGLGEATPELVVGKKYFNFKALEADPQLPDDWKAALKAWGERAFPTDSLYALPEQTKPLYNITLPSEMRDDAYADGVLPEGAFSMDFNRMFYEQAAPELMRQLLSGKLDLFLNFDARTHMDDKRLEQFIIPLVEAHPEIPAEVSPDNLKTYDYAAGLTEILFLGEMRKSEDGVVRFSPAKIGLVWSNDKHNVEREIIAVIDLENRPPKGIEINGQPLAEFLNRAPYYAYMTRCNGAYPTSLAESYYIDRLVRSGRWREIPMQRVVAEWDEARMTEAARKAWGQ